MSADETRTFAALEGPMATILPDPAPVIVCYGDDPVAFRAILAALEENEISTDDTAAHSQLKRPATLFQGPCNSILVHATQAERNQGN
jgi:hypothetical protein